MAAAKELATAAMSYGVELVTDDGGANLVAALSLRPGGFLGRGTGSVRRLSPDHPRHVRVAPLRAAPDVDGALALTTVRPRTLTPAGMALLEAVQSTDGEHWPGCHTQHAACLARRVLEEIR